MNCEDNEELYAFWLQLACGISNNVYLKIFTHFHSFKEIYECEDYSFLNGKYKCESKLKQKDLSEAYELQKRCRSAGITVLTYYDEQFPKLLKLIQAPPAILYMIGQKCDLNEIVGIAVVGTRNMTPYGAKIAEEFAYQFAIAGATVISGLAKGIDTCAHRGAIRADSFTIAVLGTPIDEIYPKENYKAFHTLYQRGLVISEMYPGCQKTRADFPNRNRIISGLAQATLIVEAGEHSGALITASHAIYQGRSVFAIPGALGDSHAGTNLLIKQGVPAATCAEDVLEDLSLSFPTKIFPERILSTPTIFSTGYTGYIPKNPINVPIKPLVPKKKRETPPELEKETEQSAKPVPEETKELPRFSSEEPESLEEQILMLLRRTAMSIDNLTAETNAEPSELLAALTILEIDGKIRSSAGNIITLNEL